MVQNLIVISQYINIRIKVWANKTSLTKPLFIEMPVDFETVQTSSYFLLFIFCYFMPSTIVFPFLVLIDIFPIRAYLIFVLHGL